MSFAETHDAKEQIRQAIDIVDLVGGYLPLHRQGRIYLGICPWHSDTRPSLQVNPERQSWKCWVCDLGGDIFNFVMQHERVDFREALELLADRARVELRRGPVRPQPQPGDPGDKRTLYAATAWAAQQFRQCLVDSPQAASARDYLTQRGVTTESCSRFQLGFSADSWQWLLDRSRSTGFSPAVLEAAGLLGRSSKSGQHYDFFKGRLIFPIRDTQSRVIGFGGRVLPEVTADTGKYRNTRETRLFSKSEHLYGLDLARDTGQVRKDRQIVIVEGYTDVIMAHQFGLRNFVAALGTALGPRHLRLLKRYADSVTLVLDGDEAGQKKTNEVLALFVAEELDVRILTLPEGLDPCDFLLQQGAATLSTMLAAAPDAFEHAFVTQTRGIDLLRDTHRAHQALEGLLTVIAQAPRLTTETKSTKHLRERQVVARLAREFGLEEAALRGRIAELRRARPAPPMTLRAADSPRTACEDLHIYEVELFEILAVHHDLAETALANLAPDRLLTTPGKAIGQTYQTIIQRGEPAEFSRVLAELENPALKNVLVALDEHAALKDEQAQEDAPARLRRLIDDLIYLAQRLQRQQALAGLERQVYKPEEELDVLQQLVEHERKRQGIPAPTDG